jgi:hypothetical protein
MNVTDKDILQGLLEAITIFESDRSKCENPIDGEIVDELKGILLKLSDDIDIYGLSGHIAELWTTLVAKSVKCLRYHDDREPYKKQDKQPMAYGAAELGHYFRKYTEFEHLLYGANARYRDHVVHVFRTWFLGLRLLLDKTLDKITLLERFKLEGVDSEDLQPDALVKISMWTLASLCHDLGYPLEKSKQILNATKEMMSFFVSNPSYNLETSFSGVQDYMNEFVLRLISSKMVLKEPENKEILYKGRVQPKYYMKFSKSLEKSNHGIISAIIVYKALVYFVESDYTVNEDYSFSQEEAKQFYIRRDILRSIASHTTNDIYHMHSNTLSFLLFICDELQEWDRRAFINFYSPTKGVKHELVLEAFKKELISWREDVKCMPDGGVLELIPIIFEQFLKYQTVFRDGQDTVTRSFDFQKKVVIDYNGSNIEIIYSIPKETTSYFSIEVHKHVSVPAYTLILDSMKKVFGKKLQQEEGKERFFKVDPYRLSIK